MWKIDVQISQNLEVSANTHDLISGTENATGYSNIWLGKKVDGVWSRDQQWAWHKASTNCNTDIVKSLELIM